MCEEGHEPQGLGVSDPVGVVDAGGERALVIRAQRVGAKELVGWFVTEEWVSTAFPQKLSARQVVTIVLP